MLRRECKTRYRRLYTDLVYEPMMEVMRHVRAHGYKTIIVTGGGQVAQALERGWSVASMKNDWKRIFAFDDA